MLLRIEHALHEYAQLTSKSIWRDEGGRHGLHNFSPSYRISPLDELWRSLHLTVLTQSDVKSDEVGREGDLVVRWFDNPLSFITELQTRRNLTVSAFAEGLSYLFEMLLFGLLNRLYLAELAEVGWLHHSLQRFATMDFAILGYWAVLRGVIPVALPSWAT